MKVSLHAADATGQPTGADLLTGKLKAVAQLDGASSERRRRRTRSRPGR
jgi:hypothetical protein